jgi:membrane protein
MPVRDAATKEGRAARWPSQLRGKDWKAILLRVWDNLGYHNVYLVAAGIGFFGMLALFPAIAALVGIYGLASDPSVIMDQMRLMRQFLPGDAYSLIEEQVTQLLAADRQTLSIASLVAIGFAIWSARMGVGAMLDGVNITYSERNERGFLAYYAVSFLMTLVFVSVVLCAIAGIVIMPAMLKTMRLGTEAEWVVAMVRWPIVVASVMLGLGILYRYGPQRTEARLPWITWGAGLATVLWLIGSLVFSWYVSKFADYNATYGSLGAIVGLMLWFYVGSYAVLLGAELNAEMEHHTVRDTTVGPEKPLGRRGAYVADHVPGYSPERDEAYQGIENLGDAAEEPESAPRPTERAGAGEGGKR